MIRRLLSAGVVAGLLSAVAPLFAHHSFDAEFDKKKPVKVEGTVKKVEWMNPHIWFYVDVKDASGKVTTWGFSSRPPGVLTRMGFSKNTLKLGDPLKVEDFGAKDGSNNADASSITFADGRKVFVGGADGAPPQ